MTDGPPASTPPAPLDPEAAAGGTEVVASHAQHRPIAPKQWLWIAAFVLVVIVALRTLGPVFTPFLIGAILAYLGTPLVDKLERRGVHRGLGTTIAVLIFGLILVALFVVLVPLVQAEIGLGVRKLPELFDRAVGRLVPWVQEVFGVTVALDVATIRGMIYENMEHVRALGIKMLSHVRSGGAIVIAILVNLALIPVVMFYVLRDWNLILGRFDELIPRRWEDEVRLLARQIDDVLAEFLHGQLLVMVVLAAYYSLGLWLAGLEHAFAIGILTGLLVFIPYVGYGLGLVLGVIAALLQWNGLPFFLAVLAVYIVGQLLENYVLVPWLVGDRIGLHPLAVIFALLAGGQLFGFAGVLLALPFSAALLVGLRHLRKVYVASPLYRD